MGRVARYERETISATRVEAEEQARREPAIDGGSLPEYFPSRLDRAARALRLLDRVGNHGDADHGERVDVEDADAALYYMDAAALTRKGILPNGEGWNAGALSWTNAAGETRASVGFEVDTGPPARRFARVRESTPPWGGRGRRPDSWTIRNPGFRIPNPHLQGPMCVERGPPSPFPYPLRKRGGGLIPGLRES